jgi:hypothetical protein
MVQEILKKIIMGKRKEMNSKKQKKEIKQKMKTYQKERESVMRCTAISTMKIVEVGLKKPHHMKTEKRMICISISKIMTRKNVNVMTTQMTTGDIREVIITQKRRLIQSKQIEDDKKGMEVKRILMHPMIQNTLLIQWD